MPGVQDIIRLSLISRRQDIINFTEAMCSEDIKLTVASDFKSVSLTDLSLILIDASLFNDFDLCALESGEKFSKFSICILPANLPSVFLYHKRIHRFSYTELLQNDSCRIYNINFLQTINHPASIENFNGYYTTKRVIS